MMWPELETELTARAWTNAAFAHRLEATPAEALAELGITVPDGLRVEIRIQDPKTLYFVIPPLRDEDDPEPMSPPNQMDLWHSRDVFAWILPEPLKVQLLAMRQQYRRFRSPATPRPATAPGEEQDG